MGFHPYYPRDLKFVNYVPNDKDVFELLVTFFGLLTASLVIFSFVVNSRSHLKGKLTCKMKIMWFFTCGLIHTILEGYFAFFHRTIPEDTTLLGQLWKEYSKGDSRYISGDSFTVCMEGITGFIDGPLAFLATYAFLANKPYRYVVQLILSLLQLYGDVLYFMTAAKEGFIHGPLWHPLYFWFYFVFMNAFWIFIPYACIVDSYLELSSAQAKRDETTTTVNSDKKRK